MVRMDGADIFARAYELADERTRDFMRKIAPYMFTTTDSAVKAALTAATGESAPRPEPGDRVIVTDGDAVVWDVTVGSSFESES